MKSKLLSIIFFICAGLCLVYFGVLAGYSGHGTSFIFVWPFFSVVFAAMGVTLRRLRRDKGGMPSFLPTFIFTSFAMAVTGFVFIMNMVVAASHSNSSQHADYCIVMGSRVYSDGISRTLLYRLDSALDLYSQSPDTVFVLAGGQEQGDPIPEAFAMYNYLSLNGVPSENMLLEARAQSTYGIITSAVRAIAADYEKRMPPKKPGEAGLMQEQKPRVGIITSDYHMFRSLTIARENGIDAPIAIAARSDSVLYIHNCVRESIAILKDFFMGNVTVDEEHMPVIPFN